MIDQDKRKAIYVLHTEGMGIREICRKLRVNRKTVRSIIRQEGEVNKATREDKIRIDPHLIEQLYSECSGRIQRIQIRLRQPWIDRHQVGGGTDEDQEQDQRVQ